MSELPDPVLVARCADAARAHASTLRVRAARLGATAEGSRWAGPAARAFRAETRALVVMLHEGAGHLDDAAVRLERHAAALRIEVAEAAHRHAEDLRRQADEVHRLRTGLNAIGVHP